MPEHLEEVAEKLFRQPVSDAELEPFYKHAKKEFDQGHSIYSGLQAGIRGMLCSPKFILRMKVNPGYWMISQLQHVCPISCGILCPTKHFLNWQNRENEEPKIPPRAGAPNASGS